MEQVKYREGYKYQLAEDYTIKTDIIGFEAETQFLKLTVIGVLTLKSGYASDGPSGPTFDTPDTIRGAFVHDGIYQLIRLGLIPSSYRDYADKLLEKLCIEDGMFRLRAKVWRFMVCKFAAFAADPKSENPILVAPRSK